MNTRLVAILAVVVLGIVGAAIWFLQMQPPTPAVATATPAPAPRTTTAGGANMIPLTPGTTVAATNTSPTATPSESSEG